MTTLACVFAFDIRVVPVRTPRMHFHSCTELIFIRRGTGCVISDGCPKRYREGQFCVYQPGKPHADRAESDGLQFCIGISGAAADCLPEGIWNATPEILNLAEELHCCKELEESRWKAMDMDLCTGRLAMKIRHLCLPPAAAERNLRMGYPEQAKHELDAHITSDFSMEELSRKLFLSKSHLRNLFREKYGESPLSYLLRRKLEYAMELLRSTSLPVCQVGLRIGMENPYYFSALFKRKNGCSPLQYRRMHQEKMRIPAFPPEKKNAPSPREENGAFSE